MTHTQEVLYPPPPARVLVFSRPLRRHQLLCTQQAPRGCLRWVGQWLGSGRPRGHPGAASVEVGSAGGPGALAARCEVLLSHSLPSQPAWTAKDRACSLIPGSPGLIPTAPPPPGPCVELRPLASGLGNARPPAASARRGRHAWLAVGGLQRGVGRVAEKNTGQTASPDLQINKGCPLRTSLYCATLESLWRAHLPGAAPGTLLPHGGLTSCTL